MKKKVVGVLLSFVVMFNMFAINRVEEEARLYKEFISTIVPECCVEPFYNQTYDYKNSITSINLGIELLAIGQKESNWKLNAVGKNYVNGVVDSYDYGPLQLNSKNYKTFVELFGPNIEGIEDKNIYYMCLCIEYYKDLRKRWDCYSAYMAYNGGEPRVRKGTPKRIVIEYADEVLEKSTSLLEDYHLYRDSKLEELRRQELENSIKTIGANVKTEIIIDSKYAESFTKNLIYNKNFVWFKREDFLQKELVA